MNQPNLVSYDPEDQRFEQWWRERCEASWSRAKTPSEQGKPMPEHWGDFAKHDAYEGWMARAMLKGQP